VFAIYLSELTRRIISLAWDEMANAASRIFNLTLAPRDQTEMTMQNCLTCGLTSIHADVES
jgi:hypothetical protein